MPNIIEIQNPCLFTSWFEEMLLYLLRVLYCMRVINACCNLIFIVRLHLRYIMHTPLYNKQPSLPYLIYYFTHSALNYKYIFLYYKSYNNRPVFLGPTEQTKTERDLKFGTYVKSSRAYEI